MGTIHFLVLGGNTPIPRPSPLPAGAEGEGPAVCYTSLLWEGINEYYAPDFP